MTERPPLRGRYAGAAGPRWPLAGAFLAALLVAFGVAYAVLQGSPLRSAEAVALAHLDAPVSGEARRVRVVVREGETAATIAQKLASRGLIRNPEVFRWVARWRGVDERFLPGEYELSPDMTLTEIMRALQAGDPRSGLVTWIEGWRAAQMADALDGHGLIPRAALMAAVARADHPLARRLELPAGATLEGYLFPDSYQLGRTASADAVVAVALETFERRVGALWQRYRARAALSLHDVVTLASIVEREAQRPEERALIAGVFLNRMRVGMPLQADPTVQFALAGPAPLRRPTDGYWKSPLAANDLEVDSPYNTYRRAGLPPGPIASPGLAALQAVLEPQSTEYLYFVAAEDGRHVFARTYEEHLKNVAATQR
ncbi:MAG: endolytic transglycosylase MltG [Chloroflexi bacterium]|nr:endolytic transglycosylase MltG [Chloroflexota bacterium]